MDTCQFFYIHGDDLLLKFVLGIECTWDELKSEFNRTGTGYPGAIYFKTISVEGPDLFAVVDDNTVFYNENGSWYRYRTAVDIEFGILYSNNSNPMYSQINRNNFNDKQWVIRSREKETDLDQY